MSNVFEKLATAIDNWATNRPSKGVLFGKASKKAPNAKEIVDAFAAKPAPSGQLKIVPRPAPKAKSQ